MSKPTVEASPRIVRPGDGRQIGAGGVSIEFKVTQEDGAGFSLIDYAVPPQFRAPPTLHWHTREHAFLIVTEGSIQVGLADERTELLESGDLIHLPPGAAFRWSNPHDAPARCICIYSPAGFEQMFDDIAEAVADAGQPPQDVMPRIIPGLWEKYGIES